MEHLTFFMQVSTDLQGLCEGLFKVWLWSIYFKSVNTLGYLLFQICHLYKISLCLITFEFIFEACYYLFLHCFSNYPDLYKLILLRYFETNVWVHQSKPFYQIYTLQDMSTNDRSDIIHASNVSFLLVCLHVKFQCLKSTYKSEFSQAKTQLTSQYS